MPGRPYHSAKAEIVYSGIAEIIYIRIHAVLGYKELRESDDRAGSETAQYFQLPLYCIMARSVFNHVLQMKTLIIIIVIKTRRQKW